MNITSCDVIINIPPSTSRWIRSVPLLTLRLELKCPVCSETALTAEYLNLDPSTLHDVRTSGEDELAYQLGRIVDQLGESRACVDCGVVSMVPPGLLSRFKPLLVAGVSVEELRSWTEQVKDELSVDGRQPPQVKPFSQTQWSIEDVL